ncbi:hypothetical protein ACFV3F_39310 [Streptomyces sp. NPDC059717]|uniref:hypothetical protein n=1 Tax=Streptomyces sp. NPDC059717 TaxID=3346922 RepID=UPI0036A5CF49
MGSPKTPATFAEAAAEAIRGLNHLTRAPRTDWQYPGDAYATVASLATLTFRLPQAFAQIAQFIERLAREDHIRSAKGSDGADDVAAAIAALRKAQDNAEVLAEHLDATHSALGPLAYKQ